MVEQPKAKPVVPGVVGRTRSAAIAALANAGYVASITDVYGTSKPASTVIRQNPSAGATLEQGGTVGLLVQLRPGSQAMVTVPKLTGLTQTVAERRIRALGVNVVLSYAPKSRSWPARIVRSQWPLPGHKVAVGGDIQIQISVKA